VLHAARWKYRTQKWCKNRYQYTITQVYRAVSSQIEHVLTIGIRKKNLLNCSVLPMPAQYGELRPTNDWDWFGSLGPQANFSGFVSCLHYCSDVAYRRPTKLCTILGHLLCWYTIYTFLGLLPPDRIFLLGAEFTIRPSLAFAYIGNVTARHFSSVHQPTLQRHTMNGIMELSQRVPPVLGRVAIAFGIGPHSSND